MTDISLRRVRLDDNPELEAVLVTEAPAEHTYAAYVFDKQGAWNLVGKFWDRQWTRDGNNLIRVQKLTEDSPPLLLCYRDLGGSDGVLLTTEAFQLREGKLWPVFEITNYEEVFFVSPHTTRQRVFAFRNRLVIHTIREEPPGKTVRNQCEVRRWDAAKNTFVAVLDEQMEHCDSGTGKPVAGKSSWTGLPAYP